jgi:hypothetical protein
MEDEDDVKVVPTALDAERKGNNMKREWNRILAVGVVALCLPAQAAVVNGGFEQPVGEYFNTTTLPGWTVSAGNIDVIKTYWTSQEPEQSVDLSGGVRGAIKQSVATTVNQEYRLSFYFAGNFDPAGNTSGDGTTRAVEVFWGGSSLGTFTVTKPATWSFANMGWTAASLFVTGTGSDLLEFVDVTSSSMDSRTGMALDNVSLVAVPELSTCAAGAGALLILGISGWRARKR